MGFSYDYKELSKLIHSPALEELGEGPELLELEAGDKPFNGYRYRFPDIQFPEGGMSTLYPEEAAQLGLMSEWMEQMNQIIEPDNQLKLGMPVYIGVEPDNKL